jgi:hypothetical protein
MISAYSRSSSLNISANENNKMLLAVILFPNKIHEEKFWTGIK